MHIDAAEFWTLTPRYFYGLMQEYIDQRKPKRKVLKNLDDDPAFASMFGR